MIFREGHGNDHPSVRRNSRWLAIVHLGVLIGLVSCVLPWARIGDESERTRLGGLDFPEGLILWTLCLIVGGTALIAAGSRYDSVSRRLILTILSVSLIVMGLGGWILLRIDGRALEEYTRILFGAYFEDPRAFGIVSGDDMSEVIEAFGEEAVALSSAGLPLAAGVLMTAGSLLALRGRDG